MKRTEGKEVIALVLESPALHWQRGLRRHAREIPVQQRRRVRQRDATTVG